LKTGGPLSAAVLSGFWAYLKDREVKKAREDHEKAMQENYKQVVQLTNAQTASMVKMETTLASLREVIYRLSFRKKDE
jgi:septal ring factor EnvC (AmiA/AmiB activator)